jgi:hypothetical protein
MWLSRCRFPRNAQWVIFLGTTYIECDPLGLKCRKYLNNLIYALKLSSAFTASNFTDIKISQRHHMEIPNTEFYLNRSRSIEIASRKLFTPLSNVWLSLRRCSRNSRLLDNLLWITAMLNSVRTRQMVGLVADTIRGYRWNAGRGLHIRRSFSPRKERLVKNLDVCSCRLIEAGY